MSLGSIIKSRDAIMLQSVSMFVLGALVLLFPRATVRSAIMFIGLYLILDGGLTLLSRFSEKSRVLPFLGGVATVIGFIALFDPLWLGPRLIFVLASWALVHGLMNVAEFFLVKSNRQIALWFGLSGITLLGLAFWLLGHTGPAAVIILRWIAIFGVIYGYSLLGLSYELKNREKRSVEGIRSIESKKVA